jgi:acetyltransferase-like isoleucine patch superfamily enzyme
MGRFFLYEIFTCVLTPMSGGAGYFLRKVFYPKLFKKVGKGLIIGKNVALRHPHKIHLGDNVTIDDNCVLDGRGADKLGIVLGDNVIINRNCMLLAKAGPIKIGRRSSLGSNSVVVSMENVDIGESVLTGGGCYVSAGSYHFDKSDEAIMDQGAYSKGPIIIEDNTWFGTGVVVLDGVRIGQGAVLGAAAVAVKDIPSKSVAIGIPAKVVKKI